MKKIIFFNIPAHGHTNPTLEVVRELVSRGNKVWYYSYEIFREKIEATGAVFVSCDDYDMERKLSSEDIGKIGKDIAFSTKILVDTTLCLDENVSNAIRRLQPDCIVADSMALWGKFAALKYGIPFVSSTTTFAFNKHSSRIMRQGAAEILKMIISFPKISKEVKRLQNNGYPVKTILDIIRNDDNTDTIVYTSPQFQPYSETFSDKYVFVGPSIRPVQTDIKKNKDKLIYISMGTVNIDMMTFYKECVTAFTDTDYQVIMSVGNFVDIEQFGMLPDNISVSTYVDQIAVLQKADVFISHCGMNSANESLYFGVPLVMLPQTTEQAGVAERINQLGAGIKADISDINTIFAAAEDILNDKKYKSNADIISCSMKKCSGAKGAADKILRVCKNNT